MGTDYETDTDDDNRDHECSEGFQTAYVPDCNVFWDNVSDVSELDEKRRGVTAAD